MKIRANRIGLVCMAMVLCVAMGCNDAQIHQATTAEHDFKTAVAGFQDAEIAMFQAGAVPPVLHTQIETITLQVAQSGQQVATFLQNGNKAGALVAIAQIDTSLQILASDDVGHIVDPVKKQVLQLALQAVQAIVTNVQTALS